MLVNKLLIAICLVLAAVVVWMGYRINSLENRLAQCDRQNIAHELSIAKMQDSVLEQNKAVKQMRDDYLAKKTNSDRAVIESLNRQGALEAEIQRLRGLPVKSCQDIDHLLNEALGL